MQRFATATVVVAVLVSAGCRQTPVEAPEWFTGTFEEACASASVRGTMLMLDFYSPS